MALSRSNMAGAASCQTIRVGQSPPRLSRTGQESLFWKALSISIARCHMSCHVRQLSPHPEKFQIWSPYLARALVGRKISNVVDRGTTGYRREWQESFRPKKLDILWIWKDFGSVISFESGQYLTLLPDCILIKISSCWVSRQWQKEGLLPPGSGMEGSFNYHKDQKGLTIWTNKKQIVIFSWHP